MFSFHRSSLKCQRVGEKLPHHTGKEPQAPGVHQKQEYLSAEHTAPALKDVGSGLRCAHGKGDRCGKYQHAEQYIALRRFKQQLNVIPSQNQYEYQCDQCHGTTCTYAEYRQENGIEAGKVKRRQFGIEYPLIGRPSDFQYDIYDFVRKVGQQNKEYGTDGKLHGIFRFNAGRKPVILKELPHPVKQDEPNRQSNENFIHRFCRREIPLEGVHITAQCAQNRGVDNVQSVHDLFCDPLYDSVKYAQDIDLLSFRRERLSVPLAAGEEGSDIGHNKAETVKDRPGDDDALQPGTGFVHRPPRFGKIHHQQCDSGGHNGSNGRDREDLRIHILHDLVGLFPYRCRRKDGHRVCRQHRSAEKTGKKKTPPVDMAALLPVLRLCGFQLIFHCVPP